MGADEIAKALELNEETKVLLGQLLSFGSLGGSEKPTPQWGASVMEESADFPPRADLSAELDKVIFRYYNRNDPTFEVERNAQHSSADFHRQFSNSGTEAFGASPSQVPVAIQESIGEFRKAHPDPRKACFIMMKFGDTSAHQAIEDAIKLALKKHGLIGLLARDKEYCDELYPNIQTYLHGCGFGIAVFERIESDDFNPNVSLEVGYMLGLKRPVLLLKDKTLATLHTDLVGKLYRSFDPLHPESSIPKQVEAWLEDKGLI